MKILSQVDFQDNAPFSLPIAVTTTSSTTPSISGTGAGLILCTATSAVTITLPSPTGITGLKFTFKNQTTTPSTITINQHASETIDGGTQYIIPASIGAYVTLTTDGTNWYVIDNSSYQVLHAQASSGLVSFTTEADITGATLSVVVPRNNSVVYIQGVFDFEVVNAASSATVVSLLGACSWNGSDQNANGILTLANTTANTTTYTPRVTAAQTWAVTGVVAGTYTAKLRATASASNGNNQVRATHTTITADVRLRIRA